MQLLLGSLASLQWEEGEKKELTYVRTYRSAPHQHVYIMPLPSYRLTRELTGCEAIAGACVYAEKVGRYLRPCVRMCCTHANCIIDPCEHRLNAQARTLEY